MTQSELPLYDVEELTPDIAALWMALFAEPLEMEAGTENKVVLASEVLPLPAKECGPF